MPIGMSLRALISPVRVTDAVTLPSAGRTTVTSGGMTCGFSALAACARMNSQTLTVSTQNSAAAIPRRTRHCRREPKALYSGVTD